MEFHHLRYFVAVAEELSFRRAAERLCICQPPLSRQIKALEDELGVKLLERGRGNRVELTDAGRTFFADARQVLKLAETARQRAAAAANGMHGQLVIANNSAVSSRLLPACLQRFRNAFPEVQVSIVELEQTEKLAAIHNRSVQIGLFADFGFSLPPEFERKSLLDIPIVAVAAPGHPVAKRQEPEIDPKHLDGVALLHPPARQPSCYTRRIPAICREAGITPTAIKAVDGLENLLAMVAAGYGVGILPDILGDDLRGAFRCKRLKLPAPTYQFYAVWLRGDQRPAAKNFLEIASLAAAEQRTNSAALTATESALEQLKTQPTGVKITGTINPSKNFARCDRSS